MAEDEKQSSQEDSVSGEQLQSSAEGEGNDSSASEQQQSSEDILTKLNEASGRDYKDLETALKGVKDTYSFVGKAKQKEQKESNEEEKVATPKDELASLREQVNEISLQSQEQALLKLHPESEKVIPDVKRIAQADGVSLIEAYKDSKYPDLLSEKSDAEKEEKSTVASSKSQVGSTLSSKEMKELGEKARSGSPRAQQEVVKKFLGQ